jgi:uncharacterized membrane protein
MPPNNPAREEQRMRAGHVLFAATMIWLGTLGLGSGEFTQVWQPVPQWVPMRTPLAYLCAIISLASGIGLLLRKSAAVAARGIFAALMVWLLVLRLPNLFYQSPLVLVAWTFGSTAVMVAAAWVLYVRIAGERDAPRVGFVADARGVRTAQVLFGISLVPFGLAHFLYLDATTSLIPAWLPWHTALAYGTGAAFIATGLGAATGVLGRLSAVLATLQMGMFGLIVWVPRVLAGTVSEFQWGEFVITCALTAGAWVVAESFAPTASTRQSAP